MRIHEMLKRFIIISSLLLTANASTAGTCEGHGEAIIGSLEFDITSCKVVGNLVEKSGYLSGVFTVDLRKLDTGLDKRNEHMRDKYLNVSKYPKAKFVLDPLKIGSPTFSGKFTMHGKTNKIGGVVIDASKKTLKVNFDLDVTKYGIKKPGYKNFVIGQHINLSVNI